MQEFNSISQNRQNIFFIVLRQSRASTRKSRSGLFLYYNYSFALASIADIYFVNAFQEKDAIRKLIDGMIERKKEKAGQ